MTRYIDVSDVGSLVAKIGTAEVIRSMALYIEEDFRRWHEFDKSARTANHSTGGVIELMPTSDSDRYAFKYVNGHPSNTVRNMLTVMAFGVLADVHTGYPILLSELTLTTAIRTAATSALVAKFLAKPKARSMALIGNGAQSEFQAIAFHALLGIDEIRLFDVDVAATQKLMRNLAGMKGLKAGLKAGLKVIQAESTADAVRGADIVTTVTADKTNATIITPGMLEPGMHINAVGGDCPGKTELHADVLRAARVIVEFEPQTRIEGDIQQLPAQFPVIEFYRVVTGREPGRESAGQITVFDSVGFALEDYSALRYLNDTAPAYSIGTTIELVPTLDDPKNLYQLIGSHAKGAASQWQVQEDETLAHGVD
jgi:ornithine cyclodeaminase